MRTPIGSCIFFIKQLEVMFKVYCSVDILTKKTQFLIKNDQVTQAKKYIRLITTQLMLIETFVNDLLDLKQMREGVFSLV